MKSKLKFSLKYGSILFLLYLLILATVPRLPLINAETEKKVYIAFGFHVNLYHSFRVDTNDDDGFAQDIRVIRKTIKTLDQFNKNGVPVKAVWDIDNLFSLQKRLPRYAPDIITNIKRRVKENDDEIIAMSYNNGLMSAMNKKEFSTVVARTISNHEQSGIKNIFENYSSIVRPQEMMVTPGNYNLYKQHGLDTIALYYSSITLDAFRVFSRNLSKKEAHNPLWYTNKITNEKMRLLPTYNIGDLVENVSLRDWVQKLHREQRRGRIDSDVIIFINFDGDSTFWEGLDIPSYLSWLPNTGGIKKLIETTKDLNYVEFTNLHSYLEKHPPVGEINFQQDLADGSFNGYSSWAEKSYVSEFWTHLVKNRYAQKTVASIYDYLDSPIPNEVTSAMNKSFEERLRLLSTTNFGMATPFLPRDRERVVRKFIQEMQTFQQEATHTAEKIIRKQMQKINFPSQVEGKKLLQKVFVLQETNYIKLNIALENIDENLQQEFFLLDKNNDKNNNNSAKKYSAIVVQKQKSLKNNTVKLILQSRQPIPVGIYAVYATDTNRKNQEKNILALPATVTSKNFSIEFDTNGHIVSVKKNGKAWLLKESLIPLIEYGKNNYTRPKTFVIENYSTANNLNIIMKANWSIEKAKQLQAGKVNIQLISNDEALYASCDLYYPETKRTEIFKEDSVELGRKIDSKWKQVAPLPLFLAMQGEKENLFQVNKENYLDVAVAYPVDYHRHHRHNKKLANVNNHITSAYTGISNDQGGTIVAYDSTTLSNFAAMPLKINYKSKSEEAGASVFSFGTAFGEQYYQPTWGTKNGFRSAFYTGEQFFSSAPTFNGYHYQIALRIDSHDKRKLPLQQRKLAKDYSNSPETISEFAITRKKEKQIVFQKSQIPHGFVGVFGKSHQTNIAGLFFYWEAFPNKKGKIIVEYGLNKNSLSEKIQTRATNAKIFTTTFANKPIPKNTDIFARAYFLSDSGQKSQETEIIHVKAKEKFEKENPLPITLQLNILYDTLLSYIN